MGTLSNMLIIFAVLSLGLSLINPDGWGSPLADMLSTTDETGELNLSGIYEKSYAIFALAIIGGALATLFKGDITYGLFSAFAIFLIGFTLAPINLFTSMDIPFFIKVIVGVPFALLYLLALVGWFRGSEL